MCYSGLGHTLVSRILILNKILTILQSIVITIGKGNGSFLVLIDLSAAFDTIDHDNLFMILEKFVDRYLWQCSAADKVIFL